MLDMIERIEQADVLEIEVLLKAVLRRCDELFPDRELSVISTQKNANKNAQLDSIAELLQKLKTPT